jgi:hypothetical protein
MDNKDPWFSYDKVSTSSDAFAYVQDIGNDLSDSLEHLNQGSPVRAKGLPTEKYTAGNTNDVMEGVHEESFLTQTPSKISRRYSPLTKSEYSGYRPPDPVFLSYNNNQTTNTFLPEPLAKHKSIEDIERVSVNNKFTVNKLTSTTREAAIAPEALELINILNPVEAREIQNNSTSQDIRVEKYTSTVPPIEVKKVETKINNIVQKPDSIVISKPKTLTTYNQSNNKNEQNFESSTSVSNEIKEVNSEGPTFNSTVQNVNNTSVSSNIEVKKPVVTTKLSQYTSTIDFNSFVSSNFAEIVDQKTEQKIQSRNNINVKKLVTDVNYFIESNNREFKNNISSSVNDFFSTYSEQNLNTLQNNILEVINSNRNLNVLNQEVTNLVKEYFSKNNNEFNQSLIENFSDFFNITLQEKLIKIENTTQNELSIVQNIESLLSDIKNYYESKQEEISTIISEVNNENVLTKVVQLAETYQEYKSNTQSLLNNLSSYVSSSNISQIQNNFNSQVNNADYKSDTSINAFKQEVFGFVNLYLSNAVEQNVFNELLSNINNSSSSEEINSVVNSFVSANKTENNQQVFDSLQYFSNDKYSNLASSYLNETVENELLNSFSTVVQKYLSQNEIQNSIDIQVKNELAETFTSQINRTMQSFELTELKTSIENVYNSDNINQFKSDFSEVLNKSENKTNVKAISYLNDILEKNILQYTLKSSNVLNESRYSNSVKRLVNENLHNVVSNIVHNLSEVNTYSDNKNVSTLLNNIKTINDNLLLNNSESRLVNFNLIQKSIENFLVNTQNNYESKLSKIKLNETTISPEIVNNMSYFESLSSETNSVNLKEVRNIITSMNSENFNNDSKEFIEETKIYTDLINMKNQISSEINNFVSSTFETILETNKNSTLISSKQIINLIEDAVSTFNSSDISNNAISYIKNVLQDARNPELYNSTFQLITSTNLVEDQIKNYLLENNSILADYSLQQIMNTINQPVYSDYVTFQEIKEIINNTQNSSSFGILSEIKKYINEINSDKNEEFILNLKTYLSKTETNISTKNSFDFTENLKSFINEQNSYSSEFFNQIIESVSNKFENKSALFLNNIINENVSRFNQFVETLFSSNNNNLSTEEVLNTLSNFATSNYEVSNAVNKYLSDETSNYNNEYKNLLNSDLKNQNFVFDNEFKEYINSIYNSSDKEILNVELNNFKQQISNTAVNNTFVALKSNNTEINSIENIIKNSSQNMDIKSELILNELNNAINSKSYSISETKNLETVRNYILNETFKIELINKFNESNNFSSQEFENFEKEVNIRLQKYIYTPSFINTINELRNNIVQSKNTQEVVKFYNEQKNVVLNDFKNITTNLLTAAYPEYLNTQSYSSLINAENIEDITNILSEYNSQSTSNQTSENNPITNIVLTNLFQQSSFISRLNEQVTNLIKSENVTNKSLLTQVFDNMIFSSIENKFNELNTMLMQSAVNNISQSSISTSVLALESTRIITEIIKDNLKYQKDYVDQVLNSFNISSVSKQIEIQNETIVKSLNTVVQNYNVAKVLTNTMNDNINVNQNIVNNKVIENVSKLFEENGNIYNSNESVKNSSENLTNNTTLNQQILNTLNESSVMNLFDQGVINNIVTNSKEIRTLLTEKQNNISIELNNEYLNKSNNIFDTSYKSSNLNTSNQIIENIENKVEKIENITLDFENKTNYQRSSIEIFDEINNNTQTVIHPNFDQVNLSENNTTIESVNNNNEFKNITVVKQIQENEDLEISNFRIEKVWNKFVQEEVNKIVEEVNESNSTTNQQNIVNKNETLLNNSNNVENYNKSEFNYTEGDTDKTESLSIYNTLNNNEPYINSVNKEVEEKTNYKEITELVFTRIEEKLKTYNVTTEDIIILKHKILSEVTEIYEKRSQIDIRNSEEKMKKEMKDLFYRFLNS